MKRPAGYRQVLKLLASNLRDGDLQVSLDKA